MNARQLSICLLLACCAGAHAESVLLDAGNPPLRLAGMQDPEETKVYIVQLRAPSAAAQQAAIKTGLRGPVQAAARTRFEWRLGRALSGRLELRYETGFEVR